MKTFTLKVTDNDLDNEVVRHLKLFKNEEVEITTINLSQEVSKENIAILVRDEYMIRLFISDFCGNFNVFLTNTILRDAIKNGIDILHIEDSVFQLSENQIDAKEFQLRALIYMIRPRKTVGISGGSLQKYMNELCQPMDVCNKIII